MLLGNCMETRTVSLASLFNLAKEKQCFLVFFCQKQTKNTAVLNEPLRAHFHWEGKLAYPADPGLVRHWQKVGGT